MGQAVYLSGRKTFGKFYVFKDENFFHYKENDSEMIGFHSYGDNEMYLHHLNSLRSRNLEKIIILF